MKAREGEEMARSGMVMMETLLAESMGRVNPSVEDRDREETSSSQCLRMANIEGYFS